KRKRQFEIIHDVKDDDVVSFRLQLLQARHDVGRLIVEIGDNDDDTTPFQDFGQVAKRFLEFRFLARCCSVYRMQNVGQLAGAPRRGNVIANCGVEGDQADAVALMIRKVAQAGGEDASIVELGDRSGAVVHRATDIQKDQIFGVRFAFEKLDDQLVHSRIDV